MGLKQHHKIRGREYYYQVRLIYLRIRKNSARKWRQHSWQRQYDQTNVQAQAIINTKNGINDYSSNHKP